MTIVVTRPVVSVTTKEGVSIKLDAPRLTFLQLQGPPGPTGPTGTLAIDVRTDDPPTPAVGQIWLRSDL